MHDIYSFMAVVYDKNDMEPFQVYSQGPDGQGGLQFTPVSASVGMGGKYVYKLPTGNSLYPKIDGVNKYDVAVNEINKYKLANPDLVIPSGGKRRKRKTKRTTRKNSRKNKRKTYRR